MLEVRNGAVVDRPELTDKMEPEAGSVSRDSWAERPLTRTPERLLKADFTPGRWVFSL